MTPYLLIFALCVTAIPLDSKDVNSRLPINKVVFYFLACCLIIFASFRFESGYDYDGYRSIFESISADATNVDVLIEPGFWLLLYLLKYFDFVFALAFITAASILIKIYMINKLSPMPVYSLIIYFTGAFLEKDFGQIRHGLAMSIYLLSIYYFATTAVIRSYIVLFAAILVHYSAIIALPVYFLKRYLKIRLFLLAMPLIGLIGYILDINSFALVINYLSPESHIGLKAYSHAAQNNPDNLALGINLSLVLRLGILILLVRNRNEIIEKFPLFGSILVGSYAFGVLVYMLFSSNSEFAIRLSAYFKMLDMFALPVLICTSRTMFFKILIFISGLLYSFYALIKLMYHPDLSWNFIPYRNWLFI